MTASLTRNSSVFLTFNSSYFWELKTPLLAPLSGANGYLELFNFSNEEEREESRGEGRRLG